MRPKTPARTGPGRPTKYSEELALAFLDEIARGSSIRKLIAKPEWPSHTTIHRWLQENEEFRDQYRRARELQADMLADEVIPIIDGEMPVLNKIDGVVIPNLDTAVRVSRDDRRAKYRVWKAGRMSPRKWGEDVDETNLGAIPPPILIIRSSADDVRPRPAPKANRRKEHQRN